MSKPNKRSNSGQSRKKKKSSRKKVKQLLTPFLEENFWSKYWKEALIIAATAIGLYVMCINYEYVLDDQIVITKNEFTKKGFSGVIDILTTESFTGYFGEQKNLLAGARYRPLSIVSFAIEQGIFGSSRQIRHGVNILLYALLGLMLFRLLSVLFPKTKTDPKWYFTIPFLASMLFIAHPVHSEVVANIKGRDEIMTLIGALAALYAVLVHYRTKKMLWLVLSGVFMFLGLMAKENALTFLAVIPATLYFFTDAKIKDHILALIPSFIGVIVYFIFRYNAIGFLFNSPAVVTDVMNNPFVGMNSGQSSSTIIYTLGLYVKLLFFPHPLTHDYYPYHIPIMHWGKIASILSLLVYIALAYIALKGLKKKTTISYGIFFYAITLSIVSNVFVPVGTFMNERFLFMPSIGFCIILAYLCIEYLPKLAKKRPALKYAGLAVAAIYVLGLSFKTLERVPVWENPLTLNGAAVSVSANSARSNCFMASALYTKARGTEDPNEKWKIIQEAGFFIRRAVKILPKYSSANQMYAGILGEEYYIDQDLDKLFQGFEGILRVKYNVKFVREFTDYLIKRNVNKRKLLDFIYTAGYEIIAKQHGQYDYGMDYLQKGLEHDPNDANIQFAVGKTFQLMGDQGLAQTHLNRAYQLNPALRNVQ